jgi:hypothetical protein
MKNKKWMVLFLLLAAAGCSTSRMTTSWKAKDVLVRDYKKILVIGLIRESDRTIQENMENHFVGDLKALGYDAVSSLREYGPKAFDNIDEAAAVQNMKNSGVDAVMTIVLLDKAKEQQYVPGRITFSPYGYYYNRFWGYRTTLYRRIYEPGYYVTDTKYFWESNFYEMGNQKLVYSAQTQSFDPLTSESMGHEYGKMIVADMLKNEILKKAR